MNGFLMIPRQILRTRAEPPSWGLPRPLVIAILGGALGVGALGVNRLSDGITAAGAFMVAIFIATVTVGLVLASSLEYLQSGRQSPRASLRGARCGSCHRPLADLHSVWACPICDRISTGS
jgi:hypothetical protein